ncbi:MAG: SdpI family protein [Firmicutes bacterium]|nr:SdpI family protein [Bacillota bacterium]
MLRNNRGYILVTALVTALPILVGVILWNRLPDTIATHFDSNGAADGWSGKGFAVFGLPLLLVGIHLLCTVVTTLDPRRRNIQKKLFHLVLWICPAISVFVMSGIYLYALGVPVDMTRLAGILVGLLFVIIGNYLPKCRQNYTIGIRIPWTLDDPENWNKTHRMAGWLWMGAGVVFLVLSLLGHMNFPVVVMLVLAVSAVPAVYSYLYALNRETKKGRS